jgi:hypothetical protein
LFNIPNIVANYKSKYPIKDLGKKFNLVWFKGKLILFDLKNKRYYHVYPWETAEDLNFVSYGVHVEDDFPNVRPLKIKIDGSTLDTSKFENGGSINTIK